MNPAAWLQSVPAPAEEKRKLGRALGVSLAAHAGFAVLLVVIMSEQSASVDTKTPPVRLDAVYLPMPGPSGGGGGHPAPASANKTEVPAHDPPPSPVASAPASPEPPKPSMDIPLQTSAADLLRAAGGAALSLGPGGGGPGTGAGPGNGPGLGPGDHGGSGNGPRRPGGDVTAPTLIHSVDPRYTPEALVAKITGTVEMDAVVLANGTVGEVRVTKSLDAVHGLDQEALRAARQWLFQPGLQNGRPVDVLVKLVLEFRLR